MKNGARGVNLRGFCGFGCRFGCQNPHHGRPNGDAWRKVPSGAEAEEGGRVAAWRWLVAGGESAWRVVTRNVNVVWAAGEQGFPASFWVPDSSELLFSL